MTSENELIRLLHRNSEGRGDAEDGDAHVVRPNRVGGGSRSGHRAAAADFVHVHPEEHLAPPHRVADALETRSRANTFAVAVAFAREFQIA